MDVKVGRNDPCPCGSGKKYKKCCGVNEVISLTQVLESDIDDLEKQLLHFALRNYGNQIEESFENFQQEYDLNNDDEVKFFEFVHTIWFTLFAKADQGGTILDQFINSELRRIKRPKLKQVVQSWKDARVFFGTIISIEDNSYIIEDLFSSDRLEAVVVTNLEKQYEQNGFFAAILLPFDQKFVFFPAPFDLPSLDSESAAEFIRQAYSESNYDNRNDFMTEFFMELMYDLPEVGAHYEINEMEWTEPIFQEVAEIFQTELEQMGVEQDIIDTGIYLWNLFCHKKQKKIKNPYIYVGALHYFISTFAPMETNYTQKQLAEKYGVSYGSLSSVYRELEDTLAEDLDSYEEDNEDGPVIQMGGSMATERVMQEALEEIKNQDFNNIEEINDFLSKKLVSATSGKLKDDAQSLLYDAFEADGPERYRLAEKALKQNPNLVDAYNILAEDADSLEEAIQMYEKGMWIGQKELGKAFFKENKGHFWLIFETRPFMRAKFNYAMALLELGKPNEAIAQFEELLELNPNDSQGVRYSLFIAYVERGDLQKVGRLLKQFEEDSAQSHYNTLLLELLKNGFSAKAKTLLKTAKENNKFVIPYLNERKRLPKAIPDNYGFGDEDEAIVYADAHLHLWRMIEGLRDWLK
ncbi:SEC-C metal-binding domain-containing protein [Neobacillus sp. PS3-12]|uniref:SEC-C metal-binding domain-containing protein n=1 Tax=Neobacillus sp. PS3-12 TaxID=3070677 RepID=UPI0027E00A92|nr:SEC-C metal-binding domain-containing protein [Neobacillus sp. PS3-12]WML54726.1 SEC-C metal-binding domain-containing protein [Neobacillus sp. PS3-12]